MRPAGFGRITQDEPKRGRRGSGPPIWAEGSPGQCGPRRRHGRHHAHVLKLPSLAGTDGPHIHGQLLPGVFAAALSARLPVRFLARYLQTGTLIGLVRHRLPGLRSGQRHPLRLRRERRIRLVLARTTRPVPHAGSATGKSVACRDRWMLPSWVSETRTETTASTVADRCPDKAAWPGLGSPAAGRRPAGRCWLGRPGRVSRATARPVRTTVAGRLAP